MAEPIRIEVDSEAQGFESVTVRAGERAFGLRRGQSA
jgi:hypothetical protein